MIAPERPTAAISTAAARGAEREVLAASFFNAVFTPANRTKARYRVMKGSAGSGKSVNVAQDFILKLSDERFRGANLLVVRKVDASNRDSTFAELQNAAYRIFGPWTDDIWRMNLNPMFMENVLTKNRIIFRGMNGKSQREKVKSITFSHGKLVWIWVEEATELTAGDIDVLDDRLRGDLAALNPNLFYQMTLTFNPVSAAHWIKKRYFDVEKPEVFCHHSTYLDNRFIDAAYHARMLRRKAEDPDGYRVYGLGDWGESGGVVLKNFRVHEFCTDAERFDAVYLGQDFGFNHPNVLLEVGFRDGEIYICREMVCREMDTGEIIKEAERRGFAKRMEMFCDAAEPDRIKMWKDAGYGAVAAKKEAGSVKAQIDFLQGRKIHVHPACVQVQKEMAQWRWKKDAATGGYLDEPVEVFDDAMAALRYAVQRQRLGMQVSVLK